MTIEFERIEDKWQEAWAKAGLDLSDRDSSKPSFFIIFAYPGVTGYLHVGHMRGYTVSDAIARYKRMRGFNVLFPVGTHATGNGAIAFARRVERGDESTISTLRENGCGDEEIARLKDPNAVVDFFNDVYVSQYWKRFGFLSDWRRFTCTIYQDYQKFIEWQMLRLGRKGLLIQKPYYAAACPEHGPVAIDASETDLQRGGTAELLEYTALKFRLDDRCLVAATLRPETIFGLTNFWVNPHAKYVVVRVDGERWILSKEGADKLRFQKEGVEIEGPVRPDELIGKSCTAPHTRKDIPILPSELVEPSVGTGLVMSVPSDAPYDWIGLTDLRTHPDKLKEFGISAELIDAIEPIPIIETPGWGALPAVEICGKFGINELTDPKLEDATKEIYKSGFHRGRMSSAAGEYAGLPVEEAKEKIKELLIESGEAEIFYDLSEEVVCRCGERVMVKMIPDQWFIDYSNIKLTQLSQEHARGMSIFPREYFDNIQSILGWFRERACVRQGNWLGTRFPQDRKWIVEAIADSTLYPIYYLISLYANRGEIAPENLTEGFFDFVLCDEGDLHQVSMESGLGEELLLRIKEDVDYWYPLDINLGGKEHMTVHFPVFLMNHVGLLPRKYWPRGIIVNWYITGSGEKISKSKGGAQPIPGAARRFGVDPMRLYYAHVASLYVDVAWDDERVENYRARLVRLDETFDELLSMPERGRGRIDDWLLSRLNRRVRRSIEAMESFDVRAMANEVYFELPTDLRWYFRRGGGHRETVMYVLGAWTKMMVPVTPHVAEELWGKIGGGGLASGTSYPEYSDEHDDPLAELEEDYLRRVIDDTSEILRVTGIEPKRVIMTLSPNWKVQVQRLAVAQVRSGISDVGRLIREAMTLQVKALPREEVPKFAKSLMSDLKRLSEDELGLLGAELDEFKVLDSAKGFMSDILGAQIVIQRADDESIHDPSGKAGSARPRRPSIYLE